MIWRDTVKAQDPCIVSVSRLRCRRGLNPTSPGRRLWVPLSAVRLGYVQTTGAVASGRLAPGRLAHTLAGSVAGRALERVRARCAVLEDHVVLPLKISKNLHLRVLPSTTTIGISVLGGTSASRRWPLPGGEWQQGPVAGRWRALLWRVARRATSGVCAHCRAARPGF